MPFDMKNKKLKGYQVTFQFQEELHTYIIDAYSENEAFDIVKSAISKVLPVSSLQISIEDIDILEIDQ